MSSDNSPLRIPRLILDSWSSAITQFCKTKGRKKISELKDLHGYVLQSKMDIKSLWQIFNLERQKVSAYLKNADRQTSAYLLGFHLPNVARTYMILNRLRAHDLQFDQDLTAIDIIDFGCGTGAVSSAFLCHQRKFLDNYDVQVHLLDKQKKMVACASAIASEIYGKAPVKGWVADYSEFLKKFKIGPGRRHIVCLFGNFINELRNPNHLLNWLQKLTQLENVSISILLLEPGQQKHARKTMELIESFANIALTAVYPCQGAESCPMLVRPKDWCFSEAAWVVPREQALVDRLVEMNHQKVNVAGYYFSSKKSEDKPLLRIVGKPVMTQTGARKTNYLLCDGQTIITKPASAGNTLGARGTFFQDSVNKVKNAANREKTRSDSKKK